MPQGDLLTLLVESKLLTELLLEDSVKSRELRRTLGAFEEKLWCPVPCGEDVNIVDGECMLWTLDVIAITGVHEESFLLLPPWKERISDWTLPIVQNWRRPYIIFLWRCGGLMVNALDSGSGGLGSSPGQGHCVVFLGETLYSHSASLHPGVQMGTSKCAGSNPAINQHPIQGGVAILLAASC